MAGGLRFNEGKPKMDLIDPVAMEALAGVLTLGAKKYAPYNWAKGMAWTIVIASLLRHTFKFMKGEDCDEESGLPHVDHIFCNAMFLVNYYRRHKELDDRFNQCDSQVQDLEEGTTLTSSDGTTGFIPSQR